MIEFIEVRKQYGAAVALDGISLRVAPGELCVLLGPSGSGKTTLMRMANRLVEPSSGSIRLNGRDILTEDPVALRRRIGYAIQSVGLFPHRTVAENIATTPELLGMPRAAIEARVDEMLAMMQLDPARYRGRYPSELSGGEAQRVGVARALAADPPLLLMDEPFGAIDPINRAAIREQFLELQRRLRKTILFVSHDIQEAIQLADRIALLRDGKLEQFGSPAELIASPANRFVEQFFGRDRAMLMLDALTAADALDPAATAGTRGTIPSHAPLRDLLLGLLRDGSTGIDVVDDGARIGTVTLESIGRRMARGTREEPEA